MNFIFCKLKKPQKTWISFFCKLKNPKQTWMSFLEALISECPKNRGINVPWDFNRDYRNWNTQTFSRRNMMCRCFFHEEVSAPRIEYVDKNWCVWKFYIYQQKGVLKVRIPRKGCPKSSYTAQICAVTCAFKTASNFCPLFRVQKQHPHKKGTDFFLSCPKFSFKKKAKHFVIYLMFGWRKLWTWPWITCH